MLLISTVFLVVSMFLFIYVISKLLYAILLVFYVIGLTLSSSTRHICFFF
jgi:hypothetical protein